MAQSVYVGLVANSVNSLLNTAMIDNVSVNTAATPAPEITSVSATTASAGSQVVIYGSGFGTSQGNSLVLLNDAPVTINSWAGASISITIPTGATSGYLAVSVAPSMNSSNAVDFTVTANPLPTAWLDQDVGRVGVIGSASYAGGVFTVKGAGNSLQLDTVDGFHFAYQQLSGKLSRL